MESRSHLSVDVDSSTEFLDCYANIYICDHVLVDNVTLETVDLSTYRFLQIQ